MYRNFQPGKTVTNCGVRNDADKFVSNRSHNSTYRPVSPANPMTQSKLFTTLTYLTIPKKRLTKDTDAVEAFNAHVFISVIYNNYGVLKKNSRW